MEKDLRLAEEYELSPDGLGLIAHSRDEKGKKFFYHIHKNELNTLEKWIKKIIKSDKEIKSIKIMN